MGDDLNSLLPLELAQYSDEDMEVLGASDMDSLPTASTPRATDDAEVGS